RKAEEEARHQAEELVRARAEETARRRFGGEAKPDGEVARPAVARTGRDGEEEEERASALRGRVKAKAPEVPKPARKGEEDRRRGRLTLTNALDESERARSLASMRRRTERAKARTV